MADVLKASRGDALGRDMSGAIDCRVKLRLSRIKTSAAAVVVLEVSAGEGEGEDGVEEGREERGTGWFCRGG